MSLKIIRKCEGKEVPMHAIKVCGEWRHSSTHY
jgi:hypothetical protein